MNWFDFFGLSEVDFQALLSLFNLESEDFVRKVMKDCIYVNYYSAGLSFCFENGKLTFIHIYNDESDNKDAQKFFKKFKNDLNLNNLDISDTIEKIVGKLGQPDRKGASRLMPIWISYEKLGIQIEFYDTKWENPNNSIHFLTLFKPQ